MWIFCIVFVCQEFNKRYISFSSYFSTRTLFYGSIVITHSVNKSLLDNICSYFEVTQRNFFLIIVIIFIIFPYTPMQEYTRVPSPFGHLRSYQRYAIFTNPLFASSGIRQSMLLFDLHHKDPRPIRSYGNSCELCSQLAQLKCFYRFLCTGQS